MQTNQCDSAVRSVGSVIGSGIAGPGGRGYTANGRNNRTGPTAHTARNNRTGPTARTIRGDCTARTGRTVPAGAVVIGIGSNNHGGLKFRSQ